jgi:glycosyltransferase involved in cell wall biosynthesis
VTFLYRIALKNTETIFQNPDDYHYFIDAEFVSPQRCYLILGSGVDTDKFIPTPEPQNDPPVVILPSRFVAEKGIRTLVEAAKIIQKRKVPVRVVLVGKPEDDQPTSIQHNEISQWVNEGLIEWWGWHNQMEKIYPLSHIVCLPTYYMEGIPKSLIEAAASGRPLVATNVPGCREIVHDGENGFLVPVRNPKALAEAIIKLAQDPGLRKRMGEKSREIAVASYSTDKVIEKYFQHYNII